VQEEAEVPGLQETATLARAAADGQQPHAALLEVLVSRGRVVVSLTRRQLGAVRSLVSVTLATLDAGDAYADDLPHLRRALLELDRATEDRLPRAVDWIDALALELDTAIEAAGGDEVHHHPILVKAQRLASRARAFVRSLNRSTQPKEGTP